MALDTVGVQDEPGQNARRLGLTLKGTITYALDSKIGEPGLITRDSTGRVVARFAARGEGPGEMQGGLVLSADTSVFLVGTGIQAFTPEGRLLFEKRNEVLRGLPLGTVGDGKVDLSLAIPQIADNAPWYQPGAIVRYCFPDSCVPTLIDENDALLDSVHRSRLRKELRWPPYAANSSRYVLGDGVGYRLWMFDARGKFLYRLGRSLPANIAGPRQVAVRAKTSATARRQLGRDTNVSSQNPPPVIAHFGFQGLAFDQANRLWVLGKTNDSMFVDVFADSVYLGRRVIDCFQPWDIIAALRGQWLAVVCDDRENEERPNRLRLFRISEPGTPLDATLRP